MRFTLVLSTRYGGKHSEMPLWFKDLEEAIQFAENQCNAGQEYEYYIKEDPENS